MVKRVVLTLGLVVAVLFVSGCPGAFSPLVGTWSLSTGGGFFGLELKADGTATSFLMTNILSGPLTWEINGSEFTLRHEATNSNYVYVGRVTDNSSISGAWVIWEGSNIESSDSWSATKQ
jgi:hypothetical protein